VNTLQTVLREHEPPPRPKCQPDVIRGSNPDFRMSAGSLPKCCGFITSSASVISPSVEKIGRWLYEKC